MKYKSNMYYACCGAAYLATTEAYGSKLNQLTYTPIYLLKQTKETDEDLENWSAIRLNDSLWLRVNPQTQKPLPQSIDEILQEYIPPTDRRIDLEQLFDKYNKDSPIKLINLYNSHYIVGEIRPNSYYSWDDKVKDRLDEFTKNPSNQFLEDKSYSFIITNETFNLPCVKKFIKDNEFTHVANVKGAHSNYLNFFFRDSREDR